jgi:DNA-binding response OmpR family regulator
MLLNPVVLPRVYDNGYLRVEHDTYYVTCGGERLKLTRAEFLLISRLTFEPERIVPTEDLWTHVWGTKKPLNAQSLHVFMYRLRRLLKPYGLRVENMVNVGYCLLFNGSPTND